MWQCNAHDKREARGGLPCSTRGGMVLASGAHAGTYISSESERKLQGEIERRTVALHYHYRLPFTKVGTAKRQRRS